MLAEDKLRTQAERYASSGRLEIKWIDRKARTQARNKEKELRALCAKYYGNRDYMVVVYAHMGTTYTNVRLAGDGRFVGLRYPCKAEGQVTSGIASTFPFTRVRDFVVMPKTGTITRR